MDRFIITKRSYVDDKGNSVLISFKQEHGNLCIHKKMNKALAITYVPGDIVCFVRKGKKFELANSRVSPYDECIVNGTILNKRKRYSELFQDSCLYVIEVKDINSDYTQMYQVSGITYKRVSVSDNISAHVLPKEKPKRIEREEMFGIKIYPHLVVDNINTK